MTVNIPQSTSFVAVFKAYLASDHATEATGKTIAITISKAGGAFGNPAAGATNATEISSGWYKVTLGTGDTDTVGIIAVRGAVATIDDVGIWYHVVKATNGGLTALPDTAVSTNASLLTSGTGTAQISNSSGQVILQTGTGTGQLDFTSGVVKANVTQFNGSNATSASGRPEVNTTHAAGTAWASGSLTSGVFASGAITATAIATDAIGAAELAADAVTEIANAVWDTDATGRQTQGTFGQAIGDPAADTNTIYKAVVTDATGATVGVDVVAAKADTAAIKVKTDFLPSATAGAAGGVFIAGTNAATTITTSLTTTFTGNLTGSVNSVAAGGIAASSFAAGAIDATAIANSAIDAATFAAGAIDAAALAADAGTEIATAVWASGTRSLTVLDEDSTTLDLDATIRAAVGLATANLDTQLDALPTAAENATAVWGTATKEITSISAAGLADFFLVDSGEAYADAVAGSVVKEIADNAGGGTPPTAADIADAVWDEAIAGHVGAGSTGEALSAAGGAGDPWITALPGSYSSGQAGYILGTNLNATVSSRATQTSVDTIDDILDTEFPALVTAVADLPTNAELATALGTADDAVLSAIAALTIPTAAAIADQVWDEAIADHDIVAGSTAEALAAINPSFIAAEVWSVAIGGFTDPGSAGLLLQDIPTANENADALLDRADAVETGLTPRQAMRLSAAADGGKLSGGATTTNTIRNAVADDTDRIIATVDADGNRTAITYDLT